MAAIEVDGLTKVYDGDVVANDGLTFDVDAGEIFGFLGPNGAGKTTCIRMLMGFQSPTEGTARVLGADVRDAAALRETRARVGYLPAHPGFDDDVTGATFLDHQAELKGGSRREELLELFTPPLDRPIGDYSTGNAQMLAIVQAFMHDPDLVVMDEPTSGLDPLKQELFNAFLRDERADGTSVFFSSHVLAEVRRVCDRIGVIRDGRLAALEDIDELLGRSGKRVRVLTGEPLRPADLSWDGAVDVDVTGREAKFTFTGDANALIDRLSTFDVVDIEVDEPPLEEIFMHFYGEAGETDVEEGRETGVGEDVETGIDEEAETTADGERRSAIDERRGSVTDRDYETVMHEEREPATDEEGQPDA